MYSFIVNPAAGHGRPVKIMDGLRRQLDELHVEYDVVLTEYRGHATELAKDAVARGYDSVIAIGGDGTVLEVARGVIGTNAVLGIIPGGTGNDFVKSLGISMEPATAMRQILSGVSLGVDVATIQNKNSSQDFLNIAGFGFDVDVLQNTMKMKKFIQGPLAYFFSVFVSLFKAKPCRVTLTTSKGKIQREVLLIAFANGRYYGGGMCVAPNASVADGLFDVCIVNMVPRWRIPLILPRYIKGKHLNMDCIEYFKCSSIEVEADGIDMINMDGELVKYFNGIFRIIPRLLRVYAPALAAARV